MKNDNKFTSDFYAQFRDKEEQQLDELWMIHNAGECSDDCPYDHEEGGK